MKFKMTDKLHNPWLVAAWPGMGGVSAMAAGCLVESLGAEPVASIPEREFFSINHVDVSDGIARSGRLPRSMFFTWRDPAGRHDLLIFLGEGQPILRGDELCEKVIDFAVDHGVERVVTFAALGTHVHPGKPPRVFGAVTTPELLDELGAVERVTRGKITGLNGTLLAAAAERGLEGLCLLGELPFYAAGMANPKSSRAVLEQFSKISGIDVDVATLTRQAEIMEPQLNALLEQLTDQAGAEGLFEDPEVEGDSDYVEAEPAYLDPVSEERIEQLFDAATRDLGIAEELKSELDRLGVFDAYEDRFLDLFRKAG